MKTCGCGASRNISHIKDQIADLSEEHIGGAPIENWRVIWISVNQTEAYEIGSGFESR